MKITLVNLPSPFVEDNMWVPPLGIMQVAAATRAIGHDVRVLDLAPLSAQAKDMDALLCMIRAKIEADDADVFGVSAVTPQYSTMAAIPRMAGGRRCIAGGVHPSLFPADTLGLGYASVVVGEGEEAIGRAIESDGVHAGEPVSCLDDLPLIDRRDLPGYHGPAPVMAGRGCPFRCRFCAQTVRGWRMRRPDLVAAEVAGISARDVVFYDDTFTFRAEWLREVCAMLPRGKRYRCSTRADKTTPETARMLADAGFREVCLGVESGAQAVLDTLRKGTTVAQNTRAVEVCRAHGLRVKAFIMVGNPGETEETMQATYNWIATARPDAMGLYIFHPLPGCDIYDHPERYDLEWDDLPFDRNYYAGVRALASATVRTSALSSDRITWWYRKLFEDFS
jgi:radical SAM superfamily enzyme YgiQ (UPF0313 family)